MRFPLPFSKTIIASTLVSSLFLSGCGGSGGDTSSSNKTDSSAKTIDFTITGQVTSGDFTNASVWASVGDTQVSTQVDDNGNYTLTLSLDSSNSNQAIKLMAKGDSASEHMLELVSQLNTVDVMYSLAGDDNILKSDEHIGVNINSVTTAQYMLATEALATGEVATMQSALNIAPFDFIMAQAELIEALLTPNHQLPVDNNSESVLDVLSEPMRRKELSHYLTEHINYDDLRHEVESKITASMPKAELDLVGEYFLKPDIHDIEDAMRLRLNEDGTGEIAASYGVSLIKWKKDAQSLTLDLETPLNSYIEWREDEQGYSYLGYDKIRQLQLSTITALNGKAYYYLQRRFDQINEQTDEVINRITEQAEHAYIAISKNEVPTATKEALLGNWVLDDGNSARYARFDENNSLTLTHPLDDDIVEYGQWQLKDGNIVLNYVDNESQKAVTKKMTLIKTVFGGYQFVASQQIESDEKWLEGSLLRHNELSLTLSESNYQLKRLTASTSNFSGFTRDIFLKENLSGYGVEFAYTYLDDSGSLVLEEYSNNGNYLCYAHLEEGCKLEKVRSYIPIYKEGDKYNFVYTFDYSDEFKEEWGVTDWLGYTSVSNMQLEPSKESLYFGYFDANTRYYRYQDGHYIEYHFTMGTMSYGDKFKLGDNTMSIITRDAQGKHISTNEYPFELRGGKLYYSIDDVEQVLSISEKNTHYWQVCQTKVGDDCTNDDTWRFYRSQAAMDYVLGTESFFPITQRVLNQFNSDEREPFLLNYTSQSLN